jgi:polygalacturonase
MNIKNIASLILLMFPLLKCVSQTNKGSRNKNETSTTTNYEVVFPMNEYLATDGNTPYPVIAQKKIENIDTRNFINVMDYGAYGDGSRADDVAIAKAFAACKDEGGVLFPKGKAFLIQNLIRISLNKNITVTAYGATIKMAPNTGYNAIAFESETTGYHHKVIWLGGTFDGNKDEQSYPGSPSK